jgi:hypothetical protein
MEKFIIRPDVTLYTGIRVTKDTCIVRYTENIQQSIENLTLCTKTHIEKENYTADYETKVFLEEGDVLLLDEERGYIKPIEAFVSVAEAIDDLKNIKEDEDVSD